MTSPRKLSLRERSELEQCEAVIDAGLAGWEKVGLALLRVEAGELYRETHASFADYLRGRWGVGKSHGYRLMAAARVTADLRESSPTGDAPLRESQARPLTPLTPAAARDVWRAATLRRPDPPAWLVEKLAREAAAREAAAPAEEEFRRVVREEAGLLERAGAERRAEDVAFRLRKLAQARQGLGELGEAEQTEVDRLGGRLAAYLESLCD